MAKSVKAQVDVSVKPYLEIDAENNQPAITTGLISSTFPSGYFGGGSFLATIDDDNNVEVAVGGVVCVSAASGAAGAATQIKNDSASGVLILKHSGFTSSAKDTAADASADIMIHSANSNSASAICKLSVENKDVFVIPYTGQACSGFYASNQAGTASKPAYLEYCFINNEE
tara:strand:+ start:324 stop:839 length:516 start_codon:yes stop_codon:yes gene_type:complete